MANNRMYFCCAKCAMDPAVLTQDKCVLFVAKYYPSTGWYTQRADFGGIVNQWFDQHNHGGMYGEYIYTLFEDALGDDMTTAKRALMDGIARVSLNTGNDKA